VKLAHTKNNNLAKLPFLGAKKASKKLLAKLLFLGS
jgi:hypothetical protein